MSKKKNNDIKMSEIRSEEIQEIIGKVPHWITRWGLSIIFSIVVIIILGSWFFKYPETFSSHIVIEFKENNSSMNEYKYFGIIRSEEKEWLRITEGMKANIKLNGYPFQRYGIIQGNVTKKFSEGDGKFFTLIALGSILETSYKRQLTFYSGMSGTAEIQTGETRLFEKIFYPFKKLFQRDLIIED